MPKLRARHQRAVAFRGEARTDIARITYVDPTPAPVKRSDQHKTAILTLLESGPASRTDLAYALDLKPASISIYLDQLADEGRLVRPSRSPRAVWMAY